MRHLVLISFVVAFLTSSFASAEEPIRVAVSPFVYLTTSTVSADDGRDAVTGGMQEWVRNESVHFELASQEAVKTAVESAANYQDALAIARFAAQQGITDYRELNTESASTGLRMAREQFYRADHQFINPVEVSETLLFAALSLLDSGGGNPTEPIDIMKEMSLIDPTRQVVAGAFPDEVVAFYESARLDLERDVRERGLSERLPNRVATLSASRDADGNIVAPTNYVLVGNVLPGKMGAVDVIVWLYDASADQFQTSAALTVRAPTAARLRDAANRLTSQLLSCLIEPTEPTAEPIPRSSGSSPFALELNLAYGSYFRFPTVGEQAVEPFGNVGSSIGGALFVTREFAILAMFQFLTSHSEFSGLVEPGFTTLRALAGGELGLNFGPFRIALGTLLEGTGVSRITTCPSPDFTGRRGCVGAEELPGRFLFGVTARPRLSFRFLTSMQVFVGGSTTFYVLPLDATSMNFLTTGEAGLQYRF